MPMSSRVILRLAFVVFCFCAALEAREPIDFQTILPRIQSSAPGGVVNGGLAFKVEKSLVLILPLPAVQSIEFDAETDGYFTLHWLAEANAPLSPNMIPNMTLLRGTTHCDLDMRICQNWSRESLPRLEIVGAGTLTLKNLAMTRIHPDTDIAATRATAQFWAPERIRGTTINFLTPVYWSSEGGYSWTFVWGCAFAVFFAIYAIVSISQKKLRKPSLVALSCLAWVLIYQLQFVIRFYPMLNKGVLVSNDDKLRNYPLSPGLGQLVVMAKEAIPENAQVIIDAKKDDWSAQILCFNLAPRRCGYKLIADDKLAGIMQANTISIPEATYWVSYFGETPLPKEFEKVYSQSALLFVARRK